MSEIYSGSFEAEFTYTGSDLGHTWTREATFFRLWAPTAAEAWVNLYRSGNPGADDRSHQFSMAAGEKGTWTLRLEGDWDGFYYTFQVLVDDVVQEACDPYARTTGVNGQRAMVLDLGSTNPEGWDQDACPLGVIPITDASIYEIHLRDLSMDANSGIVHKGKFLGLTEAGTHLDGMPTGLSHIKSLGVTHVQLMPVYDFGSVDEAHPRKEPYNWGYDPVNFNVPEGSYSTDPYDGHVRVREMKQMVKALHDNGLGVVMDVVYNHVYDRDSFCFNRLVPGYFSRPGANGSACGNDTASERSMVRKYIVDSVNYWADEYHIDGFRFDLVGLLDVQPVREIVRTVRSRHPHVLLYGEGWILDSKPTTENCPLATQQNSRLLPEFGFFNDTIRDLLRGSVFHMEVPGYASGATGKKEGLTACFMGVTPWACSPGQSINYVSCHDNHTLLDRISVSCPGIPRAELVARSRLAGAFSILSQGVPFFLGGEEMLRTKPLRGGKFDHNSFRSGDKVNALRWKDLYDPACRDTVDYYRGLLAFRKAHPALRQTTREGVLATVRPMACEDPHTLAFRIRGQDERILVIFHNDTARSTFHLPEGSWQLYISENHAGTEVLATVSGAISLAPLSTTVLIRPKSDSIQDVAAALIFRDGKFLICQRPDNKARGGLWEFVGGKREIGETLPQTLVRECREELDITVEVGEKFTEVLHEYPDIHIRLSLFLCSIPQGEPRALEHKDLQWITPSQIPDYPFCPADKEILAKILTVYGG